MCFMEFIGSKKGRWKMMMMMMMQGKRKGERGARIDEKKNFFFIAEKFFIDFVRKNLSVLVFFSFLKIIN